MQIVRPNSTFDFVGKNRIAVLLSVLVILAGLVSLVSKGGPEYGIDFAGGTLIQVQFVYPTQPGEIRDALESLGLRSLTIQQFGDQSNEFLIRTQESGTEVKQFSHTIKEALEQSFGKGGLEVRRTEMVGPQVGKELREKGLLALLYAILGTLVYISWRFEFRFAVGAVVALVHDVLITLGFFSIFGKEIDLPIIAAFLTIIGYSLNDTIIIFDRIRENLGRYPGEGFAATVNRSINETLSRTLLTSGTTLMVVTSLFLLGGAVIRNFAFALLVGIVAGTYSTIFVASALVLAWEKHRPRMEKEALPETP